MKTTIKRYTFLNTTSQAGMPTERTIKLKDIDAVCSWTNMYGNPSYVFHMNNGDTHLLVDDYGGTNDVQCSVHFKRKRKDMFCKW